MLAELLSAAVVPAATGLVWLVWWLLANYLGPRYRGRRRA